VRLSASQLVVVVATLAESLHFSDNGTFMFTEKTRRKVLEHFSSLLESIEVEVVTAPADPVTITADTGT
jgi:hypothetical protein